MEAILKFNLPEDEHSFNLAIKSSKLAAIIFDFDGYLRNEIKHNSSKYSEDEYNLLEKLRQELADRIEENSCSEIYY